MSQTILLVDDNAIQAATRKAILERAGFGVTVAPDGDGALAVLSNSEPYRVHGIRLVVTDHLMPSMNGPELVQEIRKRGFGLPVIVLSGLPEAEFSYSDLDVIFRLKPFPPDSLIALARELLCEDMPRTA